MLFRSLLLSLSLGKTHKDLTLRIQILETIFRDETSVRQNAENELQKLKKASAAEISTLKEHAKQFQEQDTALAVTFGSKFASSKKEKDDLNMKLVRCRGQGRWYWLLAMCYMGHKPSEASVCTQYGTFFGSKPKDAGNQTAGSSGVGVRVSAGGFG